MVLASRDRVIAAWCCWKHTKFITEIGCILYLLQRQPRGIMSTQNANTEEKSSGLDIALVSLAAVLALAGVCAFSLLSDQTLLVRLLSLVGGLVAAVVVAWFSPSGKRFLAYGRESYDELTRVVWPTRKETLSSTGMVIAFVVVISLLSIILSKALFIILFTSAKIFSY